jgi:hypothetical protein
MTMFSTKWKRAAAWSVAGAIVLSFAGAEAQAAKKKPAHRSTQFSSQASYGGPYSGGRGSGNYINFNDGRFGANYNPNQGG